MRLFAAFILAFALTALAAPGAMRIAKRHGLLDRPHGWKSHVRPTPYLGGAALLIGFSIAAAVFARGSGMWWLLVCCAGLCALGTLDDRWGLAASIRVAATVVVALVLWRANLGWSISSSDAVNGGLSVVWLLVTVNAINLIDLIDGAAAAAAAACAAACAAMTAALGDGPPAVFGLALCGACLGFLLHNLRSPARIFLGDGGSMPVGLLVGVLTETLPWHALGEGHALGGALAAISGAVLLCGVPLFDMAFRVFSRLRRGDSLLTAGPDSVANWLRARLPSARWVAFVLVVCQATLAGAALGAAAWSRSALSVAGLCVLALGTMLAIALDASGFGRHPAKGRAQTSAALLTPAGSPLIEAPSHHSVASEASGPG